MAKTNAFEDLLALFSDDTDKQALATLAEKNPELKNGYLRQSDYSRRMDELKSEQEKLQERVKFADTYEGWWKENYVPDALGEGKGATKRELEAIRRQEELATKLAETEKLVSAGGEMTFDQLKADFDKLLQERNLVDRPTFENVLKEKEAGVQSSLYGFAHVATKLPTLAIKHFQEFGEPLDGDELVDYAAKNQFSDLSKAYQSWASPKVEERRKAEIEKQLEEAKKAGFEEAMKTKGMNPESMPVDSQPPSMGHFQQRILGIKATPTGDVEIPEGAAVGDGTLAAIAARQQNLGS